MHWGFVLLQQPGFVSNTRPFAACQSLSLPLVSCLSSAALSNRGKRPKKQILKKKKVSTPAPAEFSLTNDLSCVHFEKQQNSRKPGHEAFCFLCDTHTVQYVW